MAEPTGKPRGSERKPIGIRHHIGQRATRNPLSDARRVPALEGQPSPEFFGLASQMPGNQMVKARVEASRKSARPLESVQAHLEPARQEVIRTISIKTGGFPLGATHHVIIG